MAGKNAVFVVLLVANGLLFGAWTWLRKADLPGNSRDAFLETRYSEEGPRTRVDKATTFRNPAYTKRFFEIMRENERILFFGTSESLHFHNMAHQINAQHEPAPKAYMYAQSGLSPVHLSVFLAKCKRDGLKFPPVALMVNLVYFTESHDVVNDGWLTNVVPSDIYLQMNHGQIMDHVGEDVEEVYDRHFRSRRWLTPLTAQKYSANLLFMKFHEPDVAAVIPDFVPQHEYVFDETKKPKYDLERNVWSGYRASDQLQKSRWQVKEVDECLNVHGLREVILTLEGTGVPFLVIVTPPNRQFYAANKIDMDLWDKRYAAIRKEIHAMVRSALLVDMFDLPMEQGFQDRMHADAWGESQMAKHVVGTDEFQTFHRKAAEFYNKLD